MDRFAQILYLYRIMPTRAARQVSLLCGVLLIAFLALAAGDGQAGIPVPARKPETPQAKPETAALPGNDLKSSDDLSDRDAALYREIFDLQLKGDMTGANAKVAELNNGLLMGHVLAQRYLHPENYRASYTELTNWLERYIDHPQAQAIHKLASARRPDGTDKMPDAPKARGAIHPISTHLPYTEKVYHPKVKRTDAQNKSVDRLASDIRRRVREYEVTNALMLLKTDEAAKHLDGVETDRLKAQIAAGYLYAGFPDRAVDVSGSVISRSGRYAPLAGWVNGIAHWQQKNFRASAKGFENAAQSPYASEWMVAGAAFWASRAHMRVGQVKEVSHWLKIAAAHPHTFYGLIALRALGQDPVFDWSVPELSNAMQRRIEKKKEGVRARALIKAGQISMAEFELETLGAAKDTDMREALLAYAAAHRLPALSLKLGHALARPGGGMYTAALYPMVPWEPQGGYRIDQALLHAFMRQESRFNAAAESRSGASGLMQLLPSTAGYMSGGDVSTHGLTDPARNLELGQKYVENLLADRAVAGDLMSLAIAYNAGPGKLSKWKSERKNMDDVLLFIETIPYSETRSFVERVLANFWIYRLRLGQPTETLDAVAEGKWAQYVSMDKGFLEFAESQ